MNLFFGGYSRVGPALVDLLYGGRLQPLPEAVWGLDEAVATGHVWMDTVVEESLELMAAAVLATVSLRGRQAVSESA